MDFLASFIAVRLSGVLLQFLQLQDSSQNRPWVKHSQYILRHLLLEQWHVKDATVVDFCLMTVNWVSLAIVDCFLIVFLPRPRVRLFDELLEGEFYELFSDILRIESFVPCFSNWTFWDDFCFFNSCFFSRFFICPLLLLFWSKVSSLNYPVSSFAFLNTQIKLFWFVTKILTIASSWSQETFAWWTKSCASFGLTQGCTPRTGCWCSSSRW